MSGLGLLSTVALLESLPEKALDRGQVGSVVEVLGRDVYEVEFSDDSGRSYATVAINGSMLLPLLHEPTHRAA